MTRTEMLLTFDEVYNIIMNKVVEFKLNETVSEYKLQDFCEQTSTELIKRRKEKIQLADDLADRLMWGTD